ncbi:MAG: hypothetical protein KDB99_11345 [Chitinophagaceae bacterium]|nr:hypothetical protein [Chitinophagaceae bacterium]
MQFEEFDDKIRDAAEHHHPAYNEGAWGKMNKLLDKHLPQEKKRRRGFFWWIFLPLLCGGGITWYVTTQGKNKTTLASGSATEQQVKISPAEQSITKEQDNFNTESGIEKQTDVTERDQSSTPVTNTRQQEKNFISAEKKNEKTVVLSGSSIKPVSNQPANRKANKQNVDRNITASTKPIRSDIKDKSLQEPDLVTREKKNAGINKQPDRSPANTNDPVSIPDEENKNPVNANETKQKEDLTAIDPVSEEKTEDSIAAKQGNEEQPDSTVTQSEKKKSSGNKKQKTFFIGLSAGPDHSFIRDLNKGKTKLLTGIGAGLTFGDRLTIRTGFYMVDKVYSAAPADYKAPAEFYNYYPYLEGIDANCKVYEIPVSVMYHFGNKKQKPWFASASLSSILMKRETYDYSYRYYPAGPLYNKENTIRNKNNHFLSTFTLSGGYQQKIGNRFFFMAEPYLKLPVSGIGYGKVKLSSAGLLFTVGVKPFGRKK